MFVGRRLMRLTAYRYGDLLAGVGFAPYGIRLFALEYHVITKNIRERHIGFQRRAAECEDGCEK